MRLPAVGDPQRVCWVKTTRPACLVHGCWGRTMSYRLVIEHLLFTGLCQQEALHTTHLHSMLATAVGLRGAAPQPTLPCISLDKNLLTCENMECVSGTRTRRRKRRSQLPAVPLRVPLLCLRHIPRPWSLKLGRSLLVPTTWLPPEPLSVYLL